MNTLLTNELKTEIISWKPVKDLFSDIKNKDFPVETIGIQSGFFPVLLSMVQDEKDIPGNCVVVTSTEMEAEALARDLEECGIEVNFFPWWNTMAYRPVPAGSPVFGRRISALARLMGKRSVTVMSQRCFLTPVPPPEYIRSLLIKVKPGDVLDTVELSEKLVSYGYTRVPKVTLRGEFAVRGEVLDIFLPQGNYPYRIILDFDRIEKIKTFSAENQATTDDIEELEIYPSKEVVWTEDRVKNLDENLQKLSGFDMEKSKTAEILMLSSEISGEEYFYPLAFSQKHSVLDYLDKNSLVFFADYDRLENSKEVLFKEFTGLYRGAILEHRREGDCIVFPPPEAILFDFEGLVYKQNNKIILRSLRNKNKFSEKIIEFRCDAPKSFFGNMSLFREEITALINDGWRVYVNATSESQSLRLKEILKELDLEVITGGCSSGFGIPDLKLIFIHENEIFGRRRHVPKSLKSVKSSVIDTFVELNPGDYVVHVQYGIGRFEGIQRVKALGNERDYIKLLYADEEVVFIPIEQVNLVQRYIGNEGNTPRLDVLGSKSWENRKNRVRKAVEDIARQLIDLYSRRQASQGFAFPKDTEWQTMFEASFPYEETEDQLTCIEEVKADMEKPRPMDRLICGDVGYGKTEIAMRAAFKAVMGGKQVAFLAPTTILAEQHYENMIERFQNFPVRIAQLSRFVPKSEQSKILACLRTGEVDILVGTHRIIQKDIVFHDLGLLIVDEEQRFGVKAKERLKELKNNIDSLAMSATPIPRTLHMSLLKIRDMSLLTTPPYNRQAIETVISEYNKDQVAAAVRLETQRGGQVFYLHNRVETLEETKIMLSRLVPEVMIETAHGKMDGQDLEDIFRRFKNGGFQVLVSTTIVENGIDIPNVNTIIIDRADMYGVSQLYQLRGRVGRSDRKAYAYLFYPENKSLSEIAMKRLQVISDFTELGSGFKIAMKDMEIRGAGNLLGKEQSGEIYSVGFDMYLRLLEEAVQALSDSGFQAEPEPLLELEYSGYIPDSYVSLPQTKMEVYKKISSINNNEEFERVYWELQDRFGPVPEDVASLLALAEIRILCKKMSISSLKEKKGSVMITFSKVSVVNVERLLRIIRENSGRIKLDPKRPNVLILQTGSIGLKEKSQYIREKLGALLEGN